MKERLLQEMGALAAESKWEDQLSDTILEVIEVQAEIPYQYLQRKLYSTQHVEHSGANSTTPNSANT